MLARTRMPASRLKLLTTASRKPPGGITCGCGGRSSKKVICTLLMPGVARYEESLLGVGCR